MFIANIFLLLSTSTYSMNEEMLIEVIKNNKKILVPLTAVAQHIKPLVPIKESTSISAAFLKSTFQFISEYPKEILQFLGYASLLTSILWFAKSKKCIITPGAIQKLDDEEKAEINFIKKERDETISDAYFIAENHVLKIMNKHLERGNKIHAQAQSNKVLIDDELEFVIQEEKSNRKKLLAQQKEEAQRIFDNYSESHKEQVNYIRQKRLEVECTLNASFGEFNKFSNQHREKIICSFDDLHENVAKIKKKHTELSATKKALFDNIGVDISTLEQSAKVLEDVTSQLSSNLEDISTEELTSLIRNLDEQKAILLSLEAAAEDDKSCTYIFTPALEN